MLVPHLIIKAAGLFANYFIPNYYDKAIAEVFKVINDSVLNVAFLIGEQCLAPAYLPVFTRARDEHGEARAWRFTSILFNLQLLILLGFVACFIFYPEVFVDWLTEWKGGDPEKMERRALFLKMLPFAAPGLIGMSLASLTYVVLNGYKEFFYAAFGDSVLKLSVLGGACAGVLLKSTDWRFVAGGAVAGGTLKLATHLLALGWRRIRQYRLTFKLSDPYVKAFVLLVLPLLVGVVFSQGRDQVITKALTSQANLKLYFSQGRNIADTIQFIVPYTLSIALLPFFCDLSAREDNARLGAVLTQIIRMLAWFFVPVAIALAAASFPLAQALYEGKKFNGDDIVYSALVSRIFALQLPFIATEIMVMQAFFSSRRVIAPTVLGIIFSTLSAGVSYYCVTQGIVTSAAAILTLVGFSLVLARILKALLLVVLLRRSVPVLPVAESMGFVLRIFLAAGVAGAAAFAASKLNFFDNLVAGGGRWSGKALQLFHAGIIAAATFGVFTVCSLALKLEEPRQMYAWTREKFKRRRGK